MVFDSGKIRTELKWTGKRKRLEKLPRLPFQTVEIINEPRKKTLDLYAPIEEDDYNQLIWGDNKFVMSSLLKDFEGKINLIYIDPPFATGADFKMPIRIDGEKFVKPPSGIEIKAYRDTWGEGLSSYLQMMYDRLILMKKLLAENGSIYVHMDWHVGHYMKTTLDEIFGIDNRLGEIIWNYGSPSGGRVSGSKLVKAHDLIYIYAKNRGQHKYNIIYLPYSQKYIEDWFRYRDEDGRKYRKRWRRDKKGKSYVEKQYLDESKGVPISTVWNDIQQIYADPRAYKKGMTSELTGFPTQKPESLIKRIIKISSDEGDIVADFFAGSGTTLAVAEKLGRRWIGCDLSKYAIHVTRKRLLEIPGCRPFKIRNLGSYQKHKLRENGVSNYTDFVLRLFGASPISGYSHVHGRKGRRLIQIGAPDSFVMEREIKRALQECRSANSTGLDVLGWEFEMGLYELIEELGDEYGVDIKLKQIPTDVLDMKRRELTQLTFFDLNYLNLALTVKGRNAAVEIKRFAIANLEYLPEKIRESFKDFRSYIDYWAVDFDYKGDEFHNMRQEYKTRKNNDIRTRISYNYENSGEYEVLVKVVDLFGNDTNKILHAGVK